MSPGPTRTRSAPSGGALSIAAAKVFFLVAGLAQNILTPLAIGQAPFGAYKRALAFINVLNNVVVVASMQAVSRATAQGFSARRLLALHAALGALLSGVFFALIPLIVAHQHAPQLGPVLRVLALVPVGYGLYAPLVGILNGAGAFGRQAALDASFSALRTTLIAVTGYVFARRGLDGATGASAGFAVASFVIIVAAFFAIDRRAHLASRGATHPDVRAHLRFFAGLVVAQLFQSLTLQVDLVLLGREATLRFLAAGLSADLAQASADRLAGLYAQAQAFGLVPYQILVAASYVLFPAIAAARARADESAVRGEVARGGHATLVVAGALVCAVAGAPPAVLRFLYGATSSGGAGAIPIVKAAPSLRLLAVAHGATSIAMVGVTLIAASGRARAAALLSAIVALFATVGGALGAHFAVDASAALCASLSLGLAVGITVGAIVVAFVVRGSLGPYVTARSLARVLPAAALALLAGAFIPTPSSRLACALVIPLPLVAYAIALRIFGEDLRALVRRGA